MKKLKEGYAVIQRSNGQTIGPQDKKKNKIGDIVLYTVAILVGLMGVFTFGYQIYFYYIK